jgi:hypothetical protein
MSNKGGEHVVLRVTALKKQFMRAAPASAGSSNSSTAAVGATSSRVVEQTGAAAVKELAAVVYPAVSLTAPAMAGGMELAGSRTSAAASSALATRKKAAAIIRSPAAGRAVARVPKQQLLAFIQTWQFDQDVDWCHMKRALATRLVNGAADADGMVPLDLRRAQLNCAQAGEITTQLCGVCWAEGLVGQQAISPA